MTRIIIDLYNQFKNETGRAATVKDIQALGNLYGLRIDGDFIQDIAEKKSLKLSDVDNYRV